MRAVQVRRFGGPDVLVTTEVPEPVAGPGQVVIGVAVADTLFLETQLRTGWGSDVFGLEPPYVPGTGVAGRVLSAGEGVDPGLLGREVVAGVTGGGYADKVAALAESVFEIPAGLGLREAAALQQIGPAALNVLDAAEIAPGERVLVTAAGGGLGSLLVQLAKAAGARVVAAAGSARKLRLAGELGADDVLDYSTSDWTATLDDVDVVFDGAGGQVGLDAFARTARKGRFFAYGIPGGNFAGIDPAAAEERDIRVSGIELLQFSPEQIQRLVPRTLAAGAAGLVKPVIGQTFPLTRAADAHTAIESREAIGKTLLLI
ncbi:zinc-binding dehydrogenase [Amycolatopsis nigrescens]|uniref:zinc-binding dehydrogenase n=1 Tax=Amycolatopsis nigrescens TaxID=381445 RepID=UPI0004765180|nr:zinc-binding dehydrogenase [Amycolatopsis nigrescens]